MLAPAAFQILLALMEGERHGYAIMVLMFNDYMRANTRPLLATEEQIAEAIAAL